jgi:hypothetical protein
MNDYHIVNIVAGLCGIVLMVLDWRRPQLFMIRKNIIRITTLIVISAGVAYMIGSQYMLWRANPGTMFLLPPYMPFSYFALYSVFNFIVPYMISLCAGFLLWVCMKWLNQRFGNRFFYEEELIVAPISIFLSGYPGLIIYSVSFFVLFLILSIFRLIVRSENTTSMRYVWIPLAVCVILSNEFFFNQTFWWKLLEF